ncbi:uncharacterized protein LOC110447801 [Mizuhopecten yessoensis]|uniref:Serine/threonine-protein kinase pats1 n=1 Tax=Mizuhopecten yessoensis TaxID=6573 RepID=A0A210QUJ6_MIZYE|nr:uncharacterized protein LOC110447801 [Mizuhopecten yessoensis]OWF52418.1 serine/threonine-protein kinase pats1 [Mizuhopecten yessoensis]
MSYLPPLHDAATIGNLPMVHKLVRSGHKVDKQSGQGRTPLMWAVLRGHRKVARYLLNVTPPESLSLLDVGGDNVLHYMAIMGRVWFDIWANICKMCPDALRRSSKVGRRPTDVIRRWRNRSEDHKKLWQFVCKQEYQRGVGENVEEKSNITITCIGHEGVGKTCLVKQLLEEQIPPGGPGSTDTANLLTNHLFVNQKTRKRERVKDGREMETGRQRLRRVIRRYRDKVGENTSEESDESDDIKASVSKVDTRSYTFTDDPSSTPTTPPSPFLELDEMSLEPELKVTDDQMATMETVMDVGDVEEEQTGFVTIYDFGGEKIFYNTHHCLLSSDMIFLLVFDVAMCLDSETEEEGFERIQFWLRSIATYAIDKTESELGTPPIILIGSHMDLVAGTDEEKDTKFGEVLEKLYDKPAIREIMEHHVQDMYHIDNMHDSCQNEALYQELWDKIVDVAHLQSQWKALVPARWLALEQELFKKKDQDVNVLTYQELVAINSALVVPLPTEDLKPFLLHLHLSGSILSYGLEGSTPVVMLKPQWMIDAFKHIITAPKFKKGLSPKEKLQWKDYEKTGKLSFAFLKALWSKDPSCGFLEKYEILCCVMECLGLISKPLPEDLKKDVTFYLVPCMLQTSDPNAILPVLSDQNIVMTPVLCIEFDNPFIPQAIWDKTIAACMVRFQPLNEPGYDGSQFLQCGFVCLSVDHKWNMILNCHDNVMKVIMFTTEKEKGLVRKAGAGVQLQKVLDYLLNRILQMNQQSHLGFDYFLHTDFRFTQDERRVRANDLMLEPSMKCYDSDGTKWLERKDYEVWFEEPDVEHSISDLDKTSPAGIPDRKPTVREIGRISKYIDGSFQMFFMVLGCPSQLIDQTLMEYRYLSFRSIVTRILIALCNRCPDIRFPQIYAAMKAHGMDGECLLKAVDQSEYQYDHVKGLDVPEELLETCPTQEDIPTIVAYIGKSYFNLFIELGFDPTTLDQFDLNCTSNDIKEKLAAMTTLWIQNEDFRPTLKQLLLCMHECDMDCLSLADKLMDTCKDK